MIFRRALLAAFSTAVLIGFAWGCSAADDSGTLPASGGSGNGDVDASNDGQVIMPDSGDQDSGSLRFNPLCGKGAQACVPGFPISCASFSPPAQPLEDASPGEDAAVDGQAGANGQGGAGGDSAGPEASSGAAGDGGAAGGGGAGGTTGPSGSAGEGGAAGSGGASGAAPVMPSKYNCQVQRGEAAPYEPFSSCVLAGPGAESAPCLTSSDCQAGLGCVGDQNAGLCQKYCCQDADDCDPGTYCAERPMRERANDSSNTRAPLLIPVCVHAENCDLSAPYPCPKGSECACATGTACLVVRADGTTTCATPGAGKVGEACPCAWGHVCAAATNRCLELCYTRDAAACGDGKCQSASELPEGWGVCIGVTPSGG
jgi:hypothetical protein